MAKPTDSDLYEKTKEKLYKKMPTHSAYRSSILVTNYKEAFKKKYGSSKSPYIGKKPTKTGLARWHAENWTNQRQEQGYSKRGDIYRPNVRVTSKTPKTFNELTTKEIKKAMKQKAKGERASFT